jgi:hypothetical protein
MFPKAITGDLWMLAFARPGMLVVDCPEFEGMPCVQGTNDKLGILCDSEYQPISGLIAVLYPLDEQPKIYGLFRNNDYALWSLHEESGILQTLHKIVEDSWNDELDTNGWRLNG